MTHQCLTYTAFLSSAFYAYPLVSADSNEKTDKPKIVTTLKPVTMDSSAQTDDLNPQDIRYLDQITNLSQQALNNVKTTLDTVDPMQTQPPNQSPNPAPNQTPNQTPSQAPNQNQNQGLSQSQNQNQNQNQDQNQTPNQSQNQNQPQNYNNNNNNNYQYDPSKDWRNHDMPTPLPWDKKSNKRSRSDSSPNRKDSSPNRKHDDDSSEHNNPFDSHHPQPPIIPPHPPYFPPFWKEGTTPQYYDPYNGGDKPAHGGTNAVALGLGIGIPVGVLMTCLIVGLFFWCRRRRIDKNHVFPLPFPKKGNDYEAQLDSPVYSIHDPWLLDRHLLEINYSKKLGSGAFCNVFKGKINGEAPVSIIHPGVRTQQLRDCPVAVKMLPSFADDIARSDFMQEINFMKSLAYHPHLVSMLGFVADRKSPYLLVEFCEHGDLLHMIRSRREEIIQGPTGDMNNANLKIKDLLMFSWQISNGLEYLNSIGCIHRDIAARNVLVDSSNTCKIGDFGLCRLTDSLLYTARGGRLPLKWMAPESLSSYEYSFKSDVWSYGVLLWELFSLGEVPFAEIQTTDLLQTHRSGKRLDQPVYSPDEIYNVMQMCWRMSPDDRPTFQHICSNMATLLENATENYGYLIPMSKREVNTNNQNDEQCDNV